jgi:hypothetical protein
MHYFLNLKYSNGIPHSLSLSLSLSFAYRHTHTQNTCMHFCFLKNSLKIKGLERSLKCYPNHPCTIKRSKTGPSQNKKKILDFVIYLDIHILCRKNVTKYIAWSIISLSVFIHKLDMKSAISP